ncbi:kinase-like domain-containing protein [Rhodocollybia butyracea]|uniref:non-specific serine/threonine protein kinase n=1 Tax=Rhodocollybia butyracea TaxID=206335 RepID=A0A9P5UFN2_9AGAR|nr:kinase-like domain-containing protein [Rhodocollybia butyracea]
MSLTTSKKISHKVKKFLNLFALGIATKHRRGAQYDYPKQTLFQPDIYLPGHVWDSQNPGERYASVGDLCAHIGDQLPIHLVKRIARDVLRDLANLHGTRGKAHGDINPDNILISPRDMKTLISQFYGDGQSQHTILQSSEMSDAETHLFNVDTAVVPDSSSAPILFRLCCSEIGRPPRHDPFCDRFGMRPPETLLDAPQSMSADLWTLGCVLYELITGESLFDPFFQTVELGLTPEESHLIQIIELLGEFSCDVVKTGKNWRRWFYNDGSLRLDTTYYPITLKDILELRIEGAEVPHTADLLGSMLRLRPHERAKPADLINHPWFDNVEDEHI